MNFEDAVAQYVSDHIAELEKNYTWKFSLDKLPIEIRFNNESWFRKNISLRKALHDKWKTSTQEQRQIISNWYIVNWGGVRANSQEKLEYYASSKPEKLIARQTDGIASWSKSLSDVDPTRFAIFDARVSSSLNSIQIISNVSDPRYFPDLPSRNKTIVSAATTTKSTVKKDWNSVNKDTFYSEYNALLGNIATKIGNGCTLQMAEMVLFARAELLADEIQIKIAPQST